MKNRYSSTTELPCIPLVCLQNAKDQTTTDVIKGKNTVIGKCPNMDLLCTLSRVCGSHFLVIFRYLYLTLDDNIV